MYSSPKVFEQLKTISQWLALIVAIGTGAAKVAGFFRDPLTTLYTVTTATLLTIVVFVWTVFSIKPSATNARQFNEQKDTIRAFQNMFWRILAACVVVLLILLIQLYQAARQCANVQFVEDRSKYLRFVSLPDISALRGVPISQGGQEDLGATHEFTVSKVPHRTFMQVVDVRVTVERVQTPPQLAFLPQGPKGANFPYVFIVEIASKLGVYEATTLLIPDPKSYTYTRLDLKTEGVRPTIDFNDDIRKNFRLVVTSPDTGLFKYTAHLIVRSSGGYDSIEIARNDVMFFDKTMLLQAANNWLSLDADQKQKAHRLWPKSQSTPDGIDVLNSAVIKNGAAMFFPSGSAPATGPREKD